MRRDAPDLPDHVREGKTLPEQIEGDHAYRDEPPEPPEPVVVTIYTIEEESGNTYTTRDAELAEELSEAGLTVTAETRRVIP